MDDMSIENTCPSIVAWFLISIVELAMTASSLKARVKGKMVVLASTVPLLERWALTSKTRLRRGAADIGRASPFTMTLEEPAETAGPYVIGCSPTAIVGLAILMPPYGIVAMGCPDIKVGK